MVKKILMISMGIIAVGGIFLATGCGRIGAIHRKKRRNGSLTKLKTNLIFRKNRLQK